MTWSIVSAGPRQYAHLPPSRAKIARRDIPMWVRYGTRTYRVNRTTDGTGSAVRTLCRMPSPSATQTAFDDRTRIAALLTDTTHSGSYVALRTNAVAASRMSGIAAALLGDAVSRRQIADPVRGPCANTPRYIR